MGPLYLASASPRRADLLALAGFDPRIVPSRAPERRRTGEPPGALVLRLARAKAGAVERVLRARGARAGLVLAADTVVAAGARVLGKPRGPKAAAAMLRSLSGRAHSVHTGVCLLRLDGGRREAAAFVETTRVFFRALGADEIAGYVATGDPLDKAGAYGIQGAAAAFVRRLQGDYCNVMGLPLARVVAALRAAGLGSPGRGAP